MCIRHIDSINFTVPVCDWDSSKHQPMKTSDFRKYEIISEKLAMRTVLISAIEYLHVIKSDNLSISDLGSIIYREIEKLEKEYEKI